MNERYIKIENNLILDTQTNRVIRNPVLIIDNQSGLIIDIVDDYIMYMSDSLQPINNHIFLRYEMNEEDADAIINNLNAYDFLMKKRDFYNLKQYIMEALGVEQEDK